MRRALERVSGYRVFAQRTLSPTEADAAAWAHAPGRVAVLAAPFAMWAILERLPGYDAAHGPERLSFVFVAADGVAAFERLYVDNGLAPAVLVLVHPGAAFGGNWTSFEDPDGPFHKAVMRAGRSPPDLVYARARSSGAAGPVAPWPECDRVVATLRREMGLHLWRRSPAARTT